MQRLCRAENERGRDTQMRAVAYYRTSSLSGIDGDSVERQSAAVWVYAGRNDIELVAEYYDAGISGTIPVDARPEFCRMINERLADTILVETASRFARKLMVQEIGYEWLKSKGVNLIPVDAPDSFTDDDDPMVHLIRVLLGEISAFERATITKRMKSGLDRKSKEIGRRIEGNAGFEAGAPHTPEFGRWNRTKHPELPTMARQYREVKPDATLREVAQSLLEQGYGRESGEPFHPGTVARWLA